MKSIFESSFSAGQISEATSLPKRTLQTWLARNIIAPQETEFENAPPSITGGGTPGHYREFSFFTVMEIAIAKAFTDAGVTDLEIVFAVASRYAHTGGGLSTPAHPQRVPGCPFLKLDEEQDTLVAIHGTKSVILTWNPMKDSTYRLGAALGVEYGGNFINASLVFDNVVTSLGHNPKEVLTLAYGGTVNE